MPDYTTSTPSDVALTGGAAKTVLSVITGATRRASLREIFVAGKSVTATDVPMLVELVQFDTDGTGTANTPSANDPAEPAAICTSKHTYSAEPTTNPVVKKQWLVPPSSGLLVQAAELREIKVPISRVLGLRVNSPQAQNVRAYIEFTE